MGCFPCTHLIVVYSLKFAAFPTFETALIVLAHITLRFICIHRCVASLCGTSMQGSLYRMVFHCAVKYFLTWYGMALYCIVLYRSVLYCMV